MRKTQPLRGDPGAITADEQAWRTEQRKNWSRQLRPQRMLAWVSLGAVGVAAFTLIILHGTLTATQDAAEAANRQAGAAKLQAQAALTATQTARTQLELSERPWVSVQASMFGSISPDVNGLTFPAQFVMHNHGNTAALNVRIKAKISLPQPHYDPLAEELKTCNQAVGSGGPALFPTQDRIERISWGLGKDEIDKARRQLPSGFKSGMFLAPMLIGCVAYTYQLALPQNHATGFIYDIAGYHREHPQVWFAIDPTKTTLGVLSDIVFSEGFFAN